MIKNKNDLLGLIIKNKNKDNSIKNTELIKLSNLDNYSLDVLIKELIQEKYIIYTLDITTLTSLGINNYISPAKSFITKLCKLLILTIKELIAFALGVGSAILVEILTK